MKILLLGILSLVITSLHITFPDSTQVSTDTQIRNLDLKKGDHIAIIGNTLADRMQEDGWLETFIQLNYPEKELTFRNLGFSGDEVNLRQREEAFGTPDEHLTHVKADVIFAFFGFNESFKGEAGLARFKQDMTDFVKHSKAQKYNGSSAPQIVLFSPIAHENLESRHLPDGSENNRRIEMYTQAIAEVAAEENVSFVNLYTLTTDLYRENKEFLTINGIHLNPLGNQLIGQKIVEELFGKSLASSEDKMQSMRNVKALNQAVKDKNFHWFNRYRTTDGYNVYGGRSWLAWEGQTNRDVMLREMDMFEVMTSNRDKAIWAIANGAESYTVKDNNLPKALEVKSYEKGKQTPRLEPYTYIGGEEAISKMTYPEELNVNLFASEEQFPGLINPMQMAFDTDERLWAVCWGTYPHWNPRSELNDKILIFPDEDGDGKADKAIVWADGLNSITGFVFWNGGVLVAAPPVLYFMKDTDGDDKADYKVRMIDGLSSADSHHSANSMQLGPDGAIYYSHGIFNKMQIETPYGPFREGDSSPGVYRFDPLTFEYSYHFPVGPNPHGDVFDQWGYQFANDATSGTGFYVNIGKRQPARQWYEKRVRPVAGIGFLSSEHFPESYQGDFLLANVIGVQGILQHDVKYEGADIKAVETGLLLESSDPNFRPSSMEIGGDGALYVLDWHNALIGHMQHNMRDPGRDHRHGRIYRITAKDRPLLTPVKMKGEKIDKIIPHLRSKQNGTRSRARTELTGRDTEKVLAEIDKFTAKLDPNNPEDAQPLLECLWVYQMHRVVNEALLEKVLSVADARTRAAAVRVLGHWGPKLDNGLTILAQYAKDPEPLVRAQAVQAAASFEGLPAAEIVFEVASLPLDIQLEEQIAFARKSVDQYWKQALEEGAKLSEPGVAFVLKNGSPNEISKLEQTEAVSRALLSHKQVPMDIGLTALNNLEKLTGKSKVDIMLELIHGEESVGTNLYSLFTGLPKKELADHKEAVWSMFSAKNTTSQARTAAVLALIKMGASASDIYAKAGASPEGMGAFLNAIQLIPDGKKRDAFYPIVRSMLFSKAEQLNLEVDLSTVMARYVRIMLPGRNAHLALAEVQVFSNDSNVALQGKARQSSTLEEKSAQRAIDGITASEGAKGIMSETSESDNPWWEVDLSTTYNIDKITLWNRTGCCGEALQNYSLMMLDENHKVVLKTDHLAQPDPTVDISVADMSGSANVGRLAILTLMNMPGHAKDAFADLNSLMEEGKLEGAAINALSDMDTKGWPESNVKNLSQAVFSYLQKTPPFDRDQITFKKGRALLTKLSKRLPDSEQMKMKSALHNMQMVEINISTIPEKMLFDLKEFKVLAGQPVKITFSNPDAMPHNVVILNPGKGQEVGMLAATMKDGFANNYVPESDDIIAASKLINKDEEDVIKFMAPEKADDYDFICSFPGHWMMMNGIMRVVPAQVENTEDYKVVYQGEHGPGVGKNIVFIASDHEYRSEESLPALARILAKRYGFHCTVVYALDEHGYILPGGSDLRGLEVLDDADLMVIFTRFSNFVDEEMQHIDDYLERGGPVMGLRTATHAFSNKGNANWEHYDFMYEGDMESWEGGFGELILGENWVGHYGQNHKQASRLIMEEDQKEHPVMTGVRDMFVQSGGYQAYPEQKGGTVLVRGQVLNGMTAAAVPDSTKEKLPVAWVRNYHLESGASGRVFTTTHGASEDLLNEGFRRMLINAALWSMGMESQIKADNNIDFVGPYKPTTFNFEGYKEQVKPSDLAGWDAVIMPGEVMKPKQ